ncbi:MAG: hypothetical protein FJ023_03830 [Chloroflexi bacterium]|nr:hypothetical protein [Chloroflexota bacterium]
MTQVFPGSLRAEGVAISYPPTLRRDCFVAGAPRNDRRKAGILRRAQDERGGRGQNKRGNRGERINKAMRLPRHCVPRNDRGKAQILRQAQDERGEEHA